MAISHITPLRALSTSCRRAAREASRGLNPTGAPPTMPRAQQGLPAKKRIPGVKKTVIVASGKGGVGKSTLAVNLAAGLSRVIPSSSSSSSSATSSSRVGILDLDIHGPSVPHLLGLQHLSEPELSDHNRMRPMVHEASGLEAMSMGFLLPKSSQMDQPVVWRGMMVMKAVQDLLWSVDWRSRHGQQDLDCLVIDMPPGTGDVQLTLGQSVVSDGAVIVSTPQDLALIDTRKGAATFNKMNVPILGAVLNQAYFTCPSCSSQHPVFGSPDKFEQAARDYKLATLAQIPVSEKLAASADVGSPLALDRQARESEPFLELARRVWSQVQ